MTLDSSRHCKESPSPFAITSLIPLVGFESIQGKSSKLNNICQLFDKMDAIPLVL